ncbi:MAG: translation initiation factor IF-3 [Xanthomonadales bacterium]|nr:translation initiation factor IF-3 [Xanthomonadales bacterium]
MATKKETRRNGTITAREIRVIAADGEQAGIMSLEEALEIAGEQSLDLVEISPNASPPVCKIMDYGKYRFENSKQKQQSKKKQKQVQLKEVKFRPGTEEADYQVKMRNIHRFIDAGNKVKVTLRFKGREMAHQELGRDLLKRVEFDMGEDIVVEQFPRMEGRLMVMMLNPKKSV